VQSGKSNTFFLCELVSQNFQKDLAYRLNAIQTPIAPNAHRKMIFAAAASCKDNLKLTAQQRTCVRSITCLGEIFRRTIVAARAR
jgi:hypothetical protein